MADLPHVNHEQIAEFKRIAISDNDTSVLMLNLNRYTTNASYPDGDLYKEYMAVLSTLLEEVGGKILWRTHEKGLRPAEEMQEGMRKNVKPHSPAVDCIWWKKDDNHHQSIMIYSSEESANQHRAQLEEFRKNSSSEYSIKMVEETMGPLIAQLSEL